MFVKAGRRKNKNKQDVLFRYEDNTLYLQDRLMLPVIPALVRGVLKEMKNTRKSSLVFDLNKVEDIDSAGVMSLFYLKEELEKSGNIIRFDGGSEQVLEKIALFSPGISHEAGVNDQPGFFERVGDRFFRFWRYYFYEYINLSASVFYFAVKDIFKSKTRREGETVNQAVQIGVNAVLIISLMSFVIGLVLALQSAQQLRIFGANIYIVDLVVLSMMAQMGPLITAILAAGRSGSAIAAEIATMKVTSELDALQTMGLDPVRFIVVPKLYAALLTIPFLIIIANVSGITGGAVAAWVYLDITPEVFINRMGGVMSNHDLVTAFVKSQAYACLIVLTGSFYGFRVVRGAEGVGKATTSAVVVAISLVIVADSIIGLLFY
jgi:phospholipid/cholesterol/gamma-HCH transport system permease protein